MFIAACCYQEGTGTEVDRVQALRWLLAPLERGNGDGVHDARALAGSMTPEQVREAGRLSGFPQAAESFL
nr:SEL1-like repeat protein [Streptomyces sp. SID11385]